MKPLRIVRASVASFPDLTNLPVSRETREQRRWLIGVDEVGRGPLFGRVYAAAVVLPTAGFDTTKVKDSKKYSSEKKIGEASDYVLQNAVAYGIAWRDEKRVDDINVLQATQECMHSAIQECIQGLENTLGTQICREDIKIMVDGTYFRAYPGVEHACFVQGDGLYPCISAASVIAKVARDAYIRDVCAQRPDLDAKYGLLKNKGYGTAKHLEGIRTHGYADGHRMSFKLKKPPV